MPEKVRPITEADVLRLASEQSFDRGIGYYNSGAIFEPVRQGDELRAHCRGSGYEPYRVGATLGPRGIESTHCSCPYDWGGICKHVVALLLAWMHEPEAFQAYAPLNETLSSRSKEELVTLIEEMIRCEPGLLRLLDLPIEPDPQSPMDLDAFRRQIHNACARGYEFLDAETLASELEFITATAERLLDAGHWANAGALYHLLLDEVVPKYEYLYDQHGDVALVLQSCAQGLDACLTEGTPSAEARRAWLEALLEADLKDVEMGGIDLAYPAGEVIVRHPTDEEWGWIEARVRQAIAAQQDPFLDWGREALVGLLAKRREMTRHDEAIDDLIFELGSPRQRAFRLVELSRADEAVEVARQHFADLPGLIFDFADALVKAGACSTAEAYVVSLLDSRNRLSCLSWLAQHAESQGNMTSALEHWRLHFHESPSLETFQSLRSAGKQLGRWAPVRQALLQELEAGEVWHLLVEIALDEGEVPRALALLPRMRSWHTDSYEIEVAQAAEGDHPQSAVDIYCRHAERLIDRRGRGNYQAAAELLTRVRGLCSRYGAQAEWEQHIADLRQRHRRLPALHDELGLAGL